MIKQQHAGGADAATPPLFHAAASATAARRHVGAREYQMAVATQQKHNDRA